MSMVRTSDVDELHRSFYVAYNAHDTEALRELGHETSGDLRPRALLIHHWALGQAALIDRDLVTAFQHFSQAMDLAREHGGREDRARVAHSFGNVHYFIGNYQPALELYHEVLSILENDPDQRAYAARIKSNIGNIYLYSDEFDLADELYQEAKQQAERSNDTAAIARALNNLALVARGRKDHARSISLGLEALPLLRDLEYESEVTIVLANVCESMLDIGKTDIDLYLDELRERCRDHDPERSTYLNIRCRLELESGNVDAAWHTIQESIECARALDSSEYLVNALTIGMNVAARRGDILSYIAFRDEHDRKHDEVRGMDARLRIAFQTKEHELDRERRKNERERALLYGALPKQVADRLIAGEDVSGDHADEASVLFMDIVGFTSISESLNPKQLIQLLRSIFSMCDEVCAECGLTKIKTIGDSYLAVAGVPEAQDDHVRRAATAASMIVSRIEALQRSRNEASPLPKGLDRVHVRIGLHCGPIIAGIVGTERLQYDIWGDTVNVASRMESHGEPGRIHVSEAFASRLRENDDGSRTAHRSPLTDSMALIKRGVIDVKGKGPMTTYWLT